MSQACFLISIIGRSCQDNLNFVITNEKTVIDSLEILRNVSGKRQFVTAQGRDTAAQFGIQ